jgi:hypothetical protein
MDIKITPADWSYKEYTDCSVYEFEYVTDTINLIANVTTSHLYIYLNDVEVFVKKKCNYGDNNSSYIYSRKNTLKWASKQVSKFLKINGAYRSEDTYYNLITTNYRDYDYIFVCYDKEALVFKVRKLKENIEFLVEAEDGIELYRKVITKKSILSTCKVTDDYYNYLIRKYLIKIGQDPNNFIYDYDNSRKEMAYKSLEYYDSEYSQQT